MEIYQTSRPIEKMRYPTAGDYLYHPGIDLFRFILAEMETKYQMLLFEHEYREAALCWVAGIKEEDITEFDLMFEEERKQGLHGEDDEPGDDPRAPYHIQHQRAEKAERDFAKDLNIEWNDYCEAIRNLFKEDTP